MIPYTLIVASANRPHLLAPTLSSLFAAIHPSERPVRVLVHDDAAFTIDRRASILSAIVSTLPGDVPITFRSDNPSIQHGPSLRWLLNEVDTEFVLYTQDDFSVIRPLPIARALDALALNDLHQIRFNKRDTLPAKETWQGPWTKVTKAYRCDVADSSIYTTLTIADHWYFQTGVWRVAPIRTVVNWLGIDSRNAIEEHIEIKVNQVMDGHRADLPHGLIRVPPSPDALDRERDQATRAAYQRTFIWGGIDEKAYIRHIGNRPEDFAMQRNRLELGGGMMNELMGRELKG